MYKKIIALAAAALLAVHGTTVCAEEADVNVRGDIDGDGIVNVTDLSKLAAHIKGSKPLEDSLFSAADIDRDGHVNISDISVLAAYIKGIRLFDGPLYKTKAEEKLAKMTLHEKVCQMFMVTPESLTGYGTVTSADGKMDSALAAYPVGGVILFAENLDTVQQTKSLINDTQAYNEKHSDIPLFFGVDEEGGTVARCAKKLGTTSFYDMYSYKDMGTQVAYNNAYTIAQDISALGFNLDFAPVADTWSNPNNTVIGWRAYSDSFSQTATLVASAVKGFNDGGVACTLKHFPGHGDTAADSHYGAACSYKTIDELEKQEYLSFQSGIAAGADMVMAGHITMTNIDDLPACISPTMINGELRGKLGYDGVVVTDALAMGAVANYYDSSALAVKCILAGDDLLLMPADLEAAVNGVEAAVADGTLTEERINESVIRILELKNQKRLI